MPLLSILADMYLDMSEGTPVLVVEVDPFPEDADEGPGAYDDYCEWDDEEAE